MLNTRATQGCHWMMASTFKGEPLCWKGSRNHKIQSKKKKLKSAKGQEEDEEVRQAPFLLLVCTSGNPSNIPEQDFPMILKCFPCRMPQFHSLVHFSLSPSLSPLSLSRFLCLHVLMQWHLSIYVAPEHGCWLMQAGDAGHSWVWLQQFI